MRSSRVGFVEEDKVFEFDRLQKYFDLRSMRIESRERREEEEEGSREESLLNEMALPFPTVSSWDPYCLGRSCSFSITKIGWGHGRG